MHGKRIVLRANVVPTAPATVLGFATRWQRQVVCVGIAAFKVVNREQDGALADA